MQSAVDSRIVFPEAFGTMFARPLVGVVTKIDLAEDDAQINLVKQRLKSAGANECLRCLRWLTKTLTIWLTFCAKHANKKWKPTNQISFILRGIGIVKLF